MRWFIGKCARPIMGIVSALTAVNITAHGAPLPRAQVYTGGSLLSIGCRTLDSIDEYSVNPANLELSKYGGWKARQVAATGFFRVEQIDGRWWAVDPEGYLYIHKAPNSIHLDDFTADEIYQLLPQYGFNGAGCWSDDEIFESSLRDDAPLAYCPKISFIAQYRAQRAPRIEMPVFDDEFPAYCNQLAQEFLPYTNDPHVFGYLSDNELPWRDEGLPAHLAINDAADRNYTTAIDFLTARGKTTNDWDTADQSAYMALMAEHYYSAVSAAIKNVDPNHMYIGSRCHSTEKTIEQFMVNAGKYVDIFSMNHYNRWGARQVEIHNMSEWSGGPLMITEFYAMQDMPGPEDGAGWLVSNQVSRGWFYQNYVSTLAETGDVVGWHWFKFQDDVNGNKGMVDASGNLYTNLMNDMQQMNCQIYNFIDHLDTRPDPDEEAILEADAYFKGTENHGGDSELWVKNAASGVYRESYLRFDLAAIGPDIATAKINLAAVAADSESGNYQAERVAGNTWGEMTIDLSNNPPGSTLLASWSHGDDIEIDVTDVLVDALALDQKLSIRIISTLNNGNIPKYGSRENTNSVARPILRIYYLSPYAVWASDEGLDKDVNDGYEDDPDSDELDNLMECALGADPLTNDVSLFRPGYQLTWEAGTNYFNYTYRRRTDREAYGLMYTMGSTADLVAEPPTNATYEAGSVPLETGFERVTNRVPVDAEAQQFMQLKVIIN